MVLNRVSSYVPMLHVCDLSIHRIDSAHENDMRTDSSIEDLLDEACRNNATAMKIVEVAGYGHFILWTVRNGTDTTNSFDDACIAFQSFVKQTSQRQICILMDAGRNKVESPPNCPYSSILVVVARYDETLASSLGLSLGLQRRITRRHRSAINERVLLGASFPRDLLRSPFLFVLVVVSCVFVGIILVAIDAMSVDPLDIDHDWMAYNTSGSIGPKHQLSISSSNASSWISSLKSDEDWVLRMDDQAIIPSRLMDDEEKHYQDWFKKQYPAVDRIRLDLDYINETWLGSPAVDQVPVDDLFHFSHCVLALRRYIKAKQTGKHVCGRDIDQDHMHHCLDALDWWAFPEGGRMDSFPNPQRPFGWRTKVCF